MWIVFIILVIPQLLALLLAVNNYRYALNKYQRKREYRPRVYLIVPFKGVDEAFDKNVSSFLEQDYEGYDVCFVVENETDPAYPRLKAFLESGASAESAKVIVAGKAQRCSQKNHNLLAAIRAKPEKTEILAFADSDVCPHRDWLGHLVYPLRQPKNGVATGYRWFVPSRNNAASLVLSALNGKVAQLLGNTRFNHVWGGSMAIRTEVFDTLEIEDIWNNAISDDLSLSTAVKQAKMKVAFAPSCLISSYTSSTWAELFEFARRQFLITRVTAIWTWLFGLGVSLLSTIGIFVCSVLGILAILHSQVSIHFWSIAGVYFASQFIAAILRQSMIWKLLPRDRERMKRARAVDLFFFWLWPMCLLALICSSAFGRTICWRGITYRLLGAKKTEILHFLKH